MTFELVFTLGVTILLVASLYLEYVNPAVSFFVASVLLVAGGVLTPLEWLQGFSNQQIVIIFMLVAITAGIRSIFGQGLFGRMFSYQLTPRAFLRRLMLFVASVSAFLNNTPIVAFMTPYVRDWSRRTGNPASKFLMPLSFATILGGMITMIGTSTSLVLNGLIESYNLPVLGLTDFLFLGLIVTCTGLLYLYLVGYRLLPGQQSGNAGADLQEYMVRTEILQGSSLIGQTIGESGLRHLREIYLVEILRHDKVVDAGASETILQPGDQLFFSGNPDAIHRLMREDNGLHMREIPVVGDRFHLIEAVVSSGSDLIGSTPRRLDFRTRFQASILAVRRKGKQIVSPLSDTELLSGDYVLLATAEVDALKNSSGLYQVSLSGKPESTERPAWHRWSGILGFVLLIGGILNLLPLFYACSIILLLFMGSGIMRWSEIRRELDLGLLVVLVCSLALGSALDRSGAARAIAGALIEAGRTAGPIAALASLFLVTTILTSIITNTAVVAIVFPVAMSMASQLNLEPAPFFVAIAFAASGDFATPIGYQTNLMVYGPGGYSFRDFLRVGGPLTLMYAAICITFISIYYAL